LSGAAPEKQGARVNYYERHIGDYARDTAHLSMLEHGAYNILLDRFYATEQGIPKDQVHRIARARSREEKSAVDSVLSEFFFLDGDVYVQKRAQGEIAKAQARINAARANGRAGGRPKASQSETHRKPTGFSTETQSKALQTPDSKHQAPEETSLRSVSLARDEVSRETTPQQGWESHRQWVLEELRPLYPSNLHTDADWELAARPLAGKLSSGGVDRETLRGLVVAFAAQQDAKGSRNTQYVENPVRHFDGRGKWRGPFALPEAQQATKRETAMDRIYRATESRESDSTEVAKYGF